MVTFMIKVTVAMTNITNIRITIITTEKNNNNNKNSGKNKL